MTPDLVFEQIQPPNPSQSSSGAHQFIHFSTHQLPGCPLPAPYPCFEFQHLSYRLNFWDSLHSYRTGEEHLFQNYYRESSVGPEILWALPSLQSPTLSPIGSPLPEPTEKRKREEKLNSQWPTVFEHKNHNKRDDDGEEHYETPSLACSYYGGQVSTSSDEDGKRLAGGDPSPNLVFKVIIPPASKKSFDQTVFSSKKPRLEY